MTVKSIFNDLLLMFAFLIIGFIIRTLVKPLRKIFLPASIIGGVILLVLGQQVLNVVTVPESFSSFSGVLIDLIMCALVFGITFNLDKLKSYLDYTLIAFGMFGMQIAIGPLVAAGLNKIWPGMPEGWGIMGVFSFYGGHGTAASAGGVFEQLGVADNLALGMIFATIGLIAAIVVGMVFVNIGVRKKQAAFLKDGDTSADKSFITLLKPEDRKPIGMERVAPVSINNLAFQTALLCTALFIGRLIFKGLGLLSPFFNSLPSMLHGIVGGFIAWQLISLLGLKEYVDKKMVNNISGFCLEIVILTAISTIKLSLVSQFFVPILIYSVVVIALTALVIFVFAKRCCKNEWFEKALMMFGMGTGSTATGLALVRTVDPQSQSCAGDAHGVFATVNLFSKFFPALLPAMIIASLWSVVGIGAAFMVGGLVLALVLFGRKKAE